ncbi:hypothetical protein VT930_11905 [Mycobacterium sherrisii]|uniref:hypothetical protein n=1 Tax=Mycobacterium sherrisii TaxID=243061 RepID=UPI002DDC9037|nr:hypothetical protein [Mycobacterium sherrisii]MEC4763808.1 hypothetical protein [Mycobacterium sherrisii]
MKIVNPPRAAEADQQAEHKVTIHEFQGNWHGVTYKGTQVSVSPDGLIQLDKHVRHADTEDLVVALRAAVPIAQELKARAAQAANAEQVPADPRRVLSERLSATPALPARASRPAKPTFTSERLARAREKLGALNDSV